MDGNYKKKISRREFLERSLILGGASCVALSGLYNIAKQFFPSLSHIYYENQFNNIIKKSERKYNYVRLSNIKSAKEMLNRIYMEKNMILTIYANAKDVKEKGIIENVYRCIVKEVYKQNPKLVIDYAKQMLNKDPFKNHDISLYFVIKPNKSSNLIMYDSYKNKGVIINAANLSKTTYIISYSVFSLR